MATYNTLEEIKVGIQTNLFGDDGLIDLRPDQRDAINYAKEYFCTKSGRKPDYLYTIRDEYRQFLWNAKMRFGKTICALQLAREMDVKRTLIVTHRPVVGDSWFGAFRQVFGTKDGAPKIRGNSDLHKVYGFGARSDDENIHQRLFRRTDIPPRCYGKADGQKRVPRRKPCRSLLRQGLYQVEENHRWNAMNSF